MPLLIRKPNSNTTINVIEELFPLVEASTLSLNDVFLQHEPATYSQAVFKKSVQDAIENGLSDFRVPAIDPSIDGDRIYFKPGSMPGVGKSANWWLENAPKYMSCCRMGFDSERIAFLAMFIKEGFATWTQICDNSKEIGHCYDSKDPKHALEQTGSRPLGKFYDLVNTFKITVKDGTDGLRFSLSGGCWDICGCTYHLGWFYELNYPDIDLRDSVGWLVIDV